jgi:uncharacterized protein involved in outer membrane biogenesis
VEAVKNTPKRRWRIVALWVVGVAVAYGIIGGLLLPPLARKMVAEKLGERLGRVVVVDSLSVNPYTLSATVKGFRILEPDGKTAFASFDQLDLDGSIASLYRLAPVADAITLAGLKVNLVRDGESHYNVSDILGRLAAAPKSKEPERKAEFSLSNIRITNGRVQFEDRPKGKKHEVTEIDVAIPFVSNLPTHLKEFVQPRFSAKVNGTPLTLTGETLPFENSLRTHVAVVLDSLEVPFYVEYSPTALPVKVDAGKLDARLSVRFTQAAGKQPSIDVAGTIGLREVGLSVPDEGALAKFGRVDVDIASFDPLGGLAHVNSLRVADASANQDEWRVTGTEAKDIRIDLGKKNVRIDSLATHDGVLALKRRHDGSIELPMRPAKGDAPAAEPSSPWVLALGSLTLDGYKLTVADASVKPAATHHVGITHLEAHDLSTEKGAKSTLAAKLVTDKAGSVDLESAFGIDPLALNARIDARRIDLVAFRPYAEHFATVGVKSANASAKGILTVSGEGDAMRIAYSGSADVSNVATVDTALREDLLNWDSVKLTGVGFQWSRTDPMNLTVAQIAVNKAYSRLVVTPEGKINLQQLKFATSDQPQAPVPAGEEPKPRNVRIDRITFADSRLDFSDHFIKPNYSADVGGLNGTVTNLSSDPASRGVVDLKGSYDATSPVVIAGTINPLSGILFLDIAAKGSDIELPKLTAYSQRYAGYGITQGKLTLDVKYHVENGKLQARNNIRLDQLTFGDKVESPEATKLPVIFAVNLLKDSKGVINVELPIAGSLEDPQFDIGGLITQVVGSLFKRAITSPFSLLTAAVGGNGGSGAAGPESGGGEDLAFVQFEPGRDEIGAAGEKKLDTVAKALLDRPAIKIEMAARIDAEKDLLALKRAALLAKVKAAKRSALAAGGKPAPDAGEITLEETEYPRYLKAAFEREKIPRPAAKEAAKENAKDGKDAAPKELTVAEMEALLLDRIEVGDDALKALALRRTEQVKGYLVGKGQLPAERVLVAAADTATPEKAHQSRVEFTLK